MLVTYTGNIIDYNNINSEEIEIEDILHSLSRINRFIGHSKRAYSVLEHSLICYEFSKTLNYTKREQLLCLIHDFAEAYVGDCPSPLKAMIPDYAEIEERVEDAVFKKMKIEKPTKTEKEQIKLVDLTALYCEMRDLTHHNEEVVSRNDVVVDIVDNFIIYDVSNVNEDNLIERASATLVDAFENARLEKLFAKE